MTRLIVCVVFAATLAWAQDRGTITGTITDSSSAPVPGATVTVKSPTTGLSQVATSATDGSYSFVYLPVGTYSLSVEKEGFKKGEASNLQLLVNTTTRVDLRLQVGTLKETVEVTGVAPLLQTDRSDLGRVVENVAIERLPLFANGGLRSNNAFALLNPGVNATITSDPDNTGGAPRVAGGVAYGNSQLLDGAESMSERRNDPQMRVVSSEGIQEFKVQSGAYSAEYGRTSNGVMNYSTKSGTNALHGTMFAVIRNNALNAKGFYYGAHTPAVHNQNLQAVSVGGPVYVPKVVDGRNKLFFYFSGERSRAKDVNAPGLISTAIQDFRNGDFRRYVGSNGQMVPLYDPYDASGNIIADANLRPRMQCNGVVNVICPNRIVPIAKFINQPNYYPLPDNPDQVFSNTYDRTNGSRTPGENQGVYSIKGDLYATQKLRVSGLFSKTYFNGYPLQGPIPGPVSEGFQEFGNFKWVRANLDYVFKPNLLNHFTFGYNQRDLGEDSIATDKTFHDATLFPGVNTKVANYSKYQTEFGNFGSHVWTRSPGRTWNLQEQVAWLKGRHSFKFGFNYIRPSYARNDCNNCAGIITTSSASTGNPGVSGTTGINYASFLLGLANSAQYSFSADINFTFRYYAWYVQDDIKLSSKLTMNVGLRYDLPFNRYEPGHQNSNFNPSIPNPGAGGLLGAMEFAGSGSGRSGRNILQYTRHNGFGPRLGIAYLLTPRTVIRAGGSLVYDSIREDGNADSGIQGFGGTYSAPSNYFSSGIALLFSTGFLDPTMQPLIAAAKPVQVSPNVANFSSP
ncbi:MAG: carboxypeptidase regulatory-like domain-containing protein, partial [Candidatus Solibacter sp.]|nr:carboxypeptidase regulatory-like domain-containing protein [Candidatus Solibacter sp.]